MFFFKKKHKRLRRAYLFAAGFTLAEMISASFAGGILMAGAYQGFTIISRQYDASRSEGDLHDAGAAALSLIESELRMAGRLAFDDAGQVPGGAVSTPVTITEPSDTAPCCMRVSVVYDRSTAARVRVTYYAAERNTGESRFALYRDAEILLNDVWVPESEGAFVADYVEAFGVYVTDTNSAGDPLEAEVELVMRAKNRGFYANQLALPVFANIAEAYEPADDKYARKWLRKTVLLRNLEKY